jgi:hypothetical protein
MRYTTARTLMSILRLSQSVAKLRFDTHVSQVCGLVVRRGWGGGEGAAAGGEGGEAVIPEARSPKG